MPTLYYIHDPMCSWCWGFRATWMHARSALKDKVNIHTVLGGLAPDNNQLMSDTMQQNIQDNWHRIQKEIPGTEFNPEFWGVCKPRRSTYPACRAVLAAGLQGEHHKQTMVLSVQQAYYLHAKNPSDDSVLIQLAIENGLDAKRFKSDFFSDECKSLLDDELQLVAKLNVSSFPNLVLNANGINTEIPIDYNNSEAIIFKILSLI